MIVKAEVKVKMLKDGREITIPCHRHCDAFYILHEFGYKQGTDYKQTGDGFLDEHGNFYDRVAAKKHAQEQGQIEETEFSELFSEDLW